MLPEDVLIIVVDLQEATSRRILISFGRVNTLCYHIAKAKWQKKLTFELEKVAFKSAVDMGRRTEFEGRLPKVHELTITDKSAHPPEKRLSRNERVIAVCRLLRQMTALRCVRYESTRIPNEVLSVLRSMPQLALRTSVLACGDRASSVPEDNLTRLYENIKLRSLEVSVPYYEASDCLKIMRLLKRLLLSCPNV